MDEPLANLELDIRDEVAALLVATQAQHGMTSVYATDDLNEGLAEGHRVALSSTKADCISLRAGRSEGSVSEKWRRMS